MLPLNVLKHLLSPRVYRAWLEAKPIDPSEWPSPEVFQRLRKGRVTREVVCVLAGVTFPALVAWERKRVVRPVALMRSASARRLVAALQLLEQDRAHDAEVAA